MKSKSAFARGIFSSLIAGVLIPFSASSARATEATYTDLYTLPVPDGLTSASPYIHALEAAAGGQAVGFGGDTTHAVLWTVASPSGIDLNPTSGFTNSYAVATNGSQQAGYGLGTATGNNLHALLWSGTAASAVDLHPLSGFTTSYPKGVGGTQQVGYGTGSATNNNIHALLRSGRSGQSEVFQATGSVIIGRRMLCAGRLITRSDIAERFVF